MTPPKDTRPKDNDDWNEQSQHISSLHPPMGHIWPGFNISHWLSQIEIEIENDGGALMMVIRFEESQGQMWDGVNVIHFPLPHP